MLQSICSQLPDTVIVIGLIGYSCLEWLLGKTPSGSLLGVLIERPLLRLKDWFISPEKPK